MKDTKKLVDDYKAWLRTTSNRDEIYKWEAVKHFQDHWDLDADDFHEMLKESLAKSANLLFLNSRGYILLAARHRPDETRAMFRGLYDESEELSVRLKRFSAAAAALHPELAKLVKKTLTPQQDERAMAFYLAMRFPERHYLYKNSFYLLACEAFGLKPAKAGGKYLHFVELADRVKREFVLQDRELLDLHRACLTTNCWQGDEANLIVQNLLYVMIERNVPPVGEEPPKGASWWIYAPGAQAKYWDEYADEGIMGLGWDEGGDLSRYANKEEIAERLRELSGDPDKSFKNDALACWEFAHGIKVGDVVIPKRGLKEYLGYGIVESEYRYEPERGDQPNIRSVRWVKRGSWLDPAGQIVQKTLTDITRYGDYVARLKSLIVDEPPVPIPPTATGFSRRPRNYILYGPPGTGKTWRTSAMALALLERRSFDSYDAESRDEVRRRYLAAKADGRVEFVTFHQSYSYEDFVEGIRPRTNGGSVSYEVEQGIFLKLCDRARARPEEAFVLVIDEINRGNVARIFGELITLIEDDKREGANEAASTRLPYSRGEFTVPGNVYLVGTMNTADRSVEALDAALRRRFSFVEVMPRPSLLSEGAFAVADLDLGLMLETMNRRIERLLDRDHLIGHAYLLGVADADDALEALREAFRDRIVPLLKEYFYNDPAKIGLVLGKRFVTRVDEDFAFAAFDDDLAARFESRGEFAFSDPPTWTLDDFASIHESEED